MEFLICKKYTNFIQCNVLSIISCISTIHEHKFKFEANSDSVRLSILEIFTKTKCVDLRISESNCNFLCSASFFCTYSVNVSIYPAYILDEELFEYMFIQSHTFQNISSVRFQENLQVLKGQNLFRNDFHSQTIQAVEIADSLYQSQTNRFNSAIVE